MGGELHAAIIPEEYHLAVALPDTDVSGEAARRHFEVARDREAARRRAGEERLAAARLHNELVEKVNRAKWQHARSGQPEGAFDVTKYPSPEDAAALERDRARNVQVPA